MASIRATKIGSFEARVWFEGKRYSRTFDSMVKAQHWAAGVECGEVELIKRMGDQTTEKPDDRLTMALSDALELYWKESVSAQKGAAKARYRICELQRESFSSKAISRVTANDVRNLKTRDLARRCSIATVTRKLSILSAFFGYVSSEWGLAVPNPVKGIVKLRGLNSPRMRRLSAVEEELLLNVCRGARTPYLAEIVELALETAMRRGELLSVRWENVEFERRLITLLDTKNGYPRYVPMTNRVLEILYSLRDRQAIRPVPMSLSALESAWKRAVSRAGLKGLRFHDLRHEGLSRWAHRLDGDIFKLSLISGHRTLQMAQRYIHPSQAELLAKLESTIKV
jgi:integrase